MIVPFLALVACGQPGGPTDRTGLQPRLAGTWQAEAFDGMLHETWQLDDDGFMRQQSVYIENGDTLYQATSKIQEVAGELILLSVIKESAPKVFQAVSRTSDQIVFENADYANPNKVTYAFIDAQNYHRTISGIQQDSAVQYLFTFRKVE